MEKLNRTEAYLERVGGAKTVKQLEAVFRRGALELGDLVRFRSGSSPSGWRYGKVTGFGPKRVRLEFRFYNGRAGKRALPYDKVRP